MIDDTQFLVATELPMKRAALAVRVSTGRQADNASPESQLKGMRAYAAKNNFQIVAELSDTISGEVPIRERNEGRKLYELVEAKQLDAVVFYTSDRTARDDLVLEYLMFKGFLAQHGVELHYADTGFDPYTMEGNLIGYLKAHQATAEKHKIRERTVRGRNTWAGRGQYVLGSKVPFGVLKVGTSHNAVWQPGELLPVVKQMADWYYQPGNSERLSLHEIAQRLDKMGIPPPHLGQCSNRWGTPNLPRWSVASVRSVLRNPIYTGVFYYGRTRKANKKRVEQPRDQWIVVPVPQLAIISQAQWNGIQERMTDNKKLARRNAHTEYLLSGFGHCKRCGAAVFGISSSYKNSTRRYTCYICGKYTQHPVEPCVFGKKRWNQKDAEAAVWEWVRGIFTDLEGVKRGIRDMKARYQKDAGAIKDQITLLDEQIEQQNRKLKRLRSLRAELDVERNDNDREADADYRAQIKQAETLRENARTKREEHERKLEQVEVTPELEARYLETAMAVEQRMRPNQPIKNKRELLRDLKLWVDFDMDLETGERVLWVHCELHPTDERLPLPSGTGKIEVKTS